MNYKLSYASNRIMKQTHFNLGVLYYNMGQLENARRELIARLKIKPDDQIARQLLNAISR